MSGGRAGCAFLATVVALAPSCVRGQDVVRIHGDSTFCECAVTVEHVATLGDTAGAGMLPGEVRQVRRNSDGIYHVLAWNDHRIIRFRPDGVALPPLIARQGRGPGEAMQIESFLMVADSVMVFDNSNARMTVFGPGGELARTVRVTGFVYDAVYVPTVGVLLNTLGSEQSTFGLPLHLLGLAGDHVRSFGGAGMVRIDAGLMWLRHVAEAANGVWAAPLNHYTLEHWRYDGRRVQAIERVTDWFEPRLTQAWGGPDEPMKPWIVDVSVDRRGYVRSIIQRGGPRWRELLPERPAGALAYPIPPGIGLFETIVEVLDPDAGRLVARGVLEPELYGFVDTDHVFSYAEDSLGNPSVSIWRLRLSGESPSSSFPVRRR